MNATLYEKSRREVQPVRMRLVIDHEGQPAGVRQTANERLALVSPRWVAKQRRHHQASNPHLLEIAGIGDEIVHVGLDRAGQERNTVLDDFLGGGHYLALLVTFHGDYFTIHAEHDNAMRSRIQQFLDEHLGRLIVDCLVLPHLSWGKEKHTTPVRFHREILAFLLS